MESNSHAALPARRYTPICALLASPSALQKPVLFCCEPYKISDTVRIDPLTLNERGLPHSHVVREPQPERAGKGLLVAVSVGQVERLPPLHTSLLPSLPFLLSTGNPAAILDAPGHPRMYGLLSPSSADDGAPAAATTPGALHVVHLQYDLVPASFVDAVLTETGLVVPSTVAAFLREYRKETVRPFLDSCRNTLPWWRGYACLVVTLCRFSASENVGGRVESFGRHPFFFSRHCTLFPFCFAQADEVPAKK